ncbi:TetR family transcriptional regulator [Kocuria coralli]|uniref:TetR family transcriptional regulator n=1 Tax=Kocuria coralli TaxID=1461025 RepID=A0A5J5KY35_9MICC|nr:TetR family transcriptional regulator [Kocuria coralli]KAA9394338.1 TetR family transcriptional regulator [Kocuria coralli]
MPLTRDQVVEAALTVAGDYGLGDLSMRRVATELGVQAGALYWHVGSKQELLIAVARRVLDPAEGAAPWPGSPQAVLAEFRRRLLAIRDGAEIVAVAHADQPSRLSPVPELRDQLESLGRGDAGATAENLVRWTLGSVLTQQTARSLAEAADPGQPGSDRSDARFDRDFQDGLRTLLAAAVPEGHAAGPAA